MLERHFWLSLLKKVVLINICVESMLDVFHIIPDEEKVQNDSLKNTSFVTIQMFTVTFLMSGCWIKVLIYKKNLPDFWMAV